MFVVVFCDDKEQAAADTIAKIDRVSKLVTRGGVTMKVQFMAKSLMDNFGEQGTLRDLPEFEPVQRFRRYQKVR